MKKSLITTATLALAAGALAGCSGGGSDGDASGDAGQGDVTTISYGLWDSNQLPAYQQCADDFAAANPEYAVDIEQIGWDDYWSKITTGFVSGENYDVFTSHVAYYPEFQANNQVLPLDEYIERDGLDMSIYQDGLVELWQNPDGVQYGLPKDFDTISLFYNEQMTEEAGYTAEDLAALTWNPDDGGTYEEFLAHMTVDTNGVRGDEAGFDKDSVDTYGLWMEGSGGADGQTQWTFLTASLGWTQTDQPWATSYNYDDPAFAETSVDWHGDTAFIDTRDVHGSADPAAEEAIDRLRDTLVPAALDGTDAVAYVGGGQAGAVDFTSVIVDNVPLVLAIVLGASFLLLLVAFRSIAIPLTAIALNVVSAAAAFGLLVGVFQFGWGADLLGFAQADAIAPWIPLFLFAVLFGLSMDYHVFLISRIKERHDTTGDTRDAVVFGLSRTGSLITGAALIMVAVFLGFALGDLAEFQQMGFGLAAAVIIDATVVRTILVPSLMTLLGRRNWILPGWLGWMPRLSVEGAPPERDEREPELVRV